MYEHYYDPEKPGSYSGFSSFAREFGNGPAARRFLEAQNAYTMHKQLRRRFPRRRTYAKGINDLWQADLMETGAISGHNDGHRYVLTCIDVFSKRARAIPLKTKSGSEIVDAFRRLIENGEKCTFLQTDKGSEWLNSKFQTFLRENDIRFYTSENEDIKAAVVERFNRTLRMKMNRYFTGKNTYRFVDVLDALIRSYNNTKHRSIGMAPNEVDASNEHLVRKRLYPLKKLAGKPKWKFAQGDHVRISARKTAFEKGYYAKWSEEIFVVKHRYPTVPPTYGIEDLSGEPIKGRFYAQELQKIVKPVDEVYTVEKIVKTRKRAGKIEYFVKWRGYPDKFNSWVDDVIGLA